MRWGLTPISDAILMTAKRGDFSPRFFRPRAYDPGARFFGKITSFNNFFTKTFVQNYILHFPYYLL